MGKSLYPQEIFFFAFSGTFIAWDCLRLSSHLAGSIQQLFPESALKNLTAISIAIGVLVTSLSQAATTQFHVEKDVRAVDLGVAPQNEVRTVTLSLAVKNLPALEAYAASTVDPSSPNYQKFLTTAQFSAAYGQDATSIAQVVNFLQASGLTVTKIQPNNLLISASGTNAQLAAVFGSPIHIYQKLGQTYEAPSSSTAVPANLAGLVKGVHGLSGQPRMHSNAIRKPHGSADLIDAVGSNAAANTTPGLYTTADLAKQYNITPLYTAGFTGAGKTIGIASLAGYSQADVFAYWKSVGLTVNPNRITNVLVDNGPPANADGADETTLDVEQSGGVAPGADMRVYLAPNTDAGFLDVFAQAINDNIVDTLSISWGSAELFSDQPTLDAFHAVFLQAAVQGIPVIASSGDSGAYDINNNFAYPGCTTLLSVDFPAADPLVLAAGGTTLPVSLRFANGVNVNVPAERAWGWDYLRDWAVKSYGQNWYYANVFPVGDGGGVSVNFARPDYQANLPGVMNSASAQSLMCSAASLGMTGTSYYPLVTLPANYAGRNLPDVSLNADPETGYKVLYQGGWITGYGGTSFVAPQLNGIFTLIASAKGKRVGTPAPQLYSAFKTLGYGAGSPFRAISSGTNLFYPSKPAFNPATGLGALDVTNLAKALGVAF
jgi:kumamolisin